MSGVASRLRPRHRLGVGVVDQVGPLAADPLAAPVPERDESLIQGAAVLGEGVLDPRRDLRVDLAVDEPVLLHLAQVLGEHLLAHPGKAPSELRETPHLVLGELPEDQTLPLTAHHIHRGVDPADVRAAARRRRHARPSTYSRVSTTENSTYFRTGR